MKFVSWNVNSVRARLNLLIDLIKELNPDVVLLQEIKCKNKDFPFNQIENLNYNIAVSGQSSYNGVAILSKFQIDEVKTDFIHNPCQTDARFIEISLNIDKVGYARLISIYVPQGGDKINGEKYLLKLKFLEALKKYLILNKRIDEFLIIGGDFNVAPEEKDVYSLDLAHSVGFSLDERQKIREILNSGFVDLYRICHPNEQEFSWWDYRHNSIYCNKGMRLDLFLSTVNFTNFIQNCFIYTDVRLQPHTSDHAPLVLLLDI